MDRETYLNKLETALRKKCPEQQVRDILSDYEDFFATGTAEGKSEAELCAEFGPPEQAALELEKESGTDTLSRNTTVATVCTVLAVLVFAAVLWSFNGPPIFFSPLLRMQSRPINFWLAMLLPLILEGVLALWLRRGNLAAKRMAWVSRTHLILAVPLAAALVWLIYYSYKAVMPLEGIWLGHAQQIMLATTWATRISELILLASIGLVISYTAHGHPKARWFLFCDTALLTVFLNLTSLLLWVSTTTYFWLDPVWRIVSCFLWAVLPNLAAAAVWWAIEKVIAVRRAKA